MFHAPVLTSIITDGCHGTQAEYPDYSIIRHFEWDYVVGILSWNAGVWSYAILDKDDYSIVSQDSAQNGPSDIPFGEFMCCFFDYMADASEEIASEIEDARDGDGYDSDSMYDDYRGDYDYPDSDLWNEY